MLLFSNENSTLIDEHTWYIGVKENTSTIVFGNAKTGWNYSLYYNYDKTNLLDKYDINES